MATEDAPYETPENPPLPSTTPPQNQTQETFQKITVVMVVILAPFIETEIVSHILK